MRAQWSATIDAITNPTTPLYVHFSCCKYMYHEFTQQTPRPMEPFPINKTSEWHFLLVNKLQDIFFLLFLLLKQIAFPVSEILSVNKSFIKHVKRMPSRSRDQSYSRFANLVRLIKYNFLKESSNNNSPFWTSSLHRLISNATIPNVLKTWNSIFC